MSQTAFRELAFFGERMALSQGNFLDIVGVTGSIPVTPTIRPLDFFALFSRQTKFPSLPLNLKRGIL